MVNGSTEEIREDVGKMQRGFDASKAKGRVCCWDFLAPVGVGQFGMRVRHRSRHGNPSESDGTYVNHMNCRRSLSIRIHYTESKKGKTGCSHTTVRHCSRQRTSKKRFFVHLLPVRRRSPVVKMTHKDRQQWYNKRGHIPDLEDITQYDHQRGGPPPHPSRPLHPNHPLHPNLVLHPNILLDPKPCLYLPPL